MISCFLGLAAVLDISDILREWQYSVLNMERKDMKGGSSGHGDRYHIRAISCIFSRCAIVLVKSRACGDSGSGSELYLGIDYAQLPISRSVYFRRHV